jgi:hypothetical protein
MEEFARDVAAVLEAESVDTAATTSRWRHPKARRSS